MVSNPGTLNAFELATLLTFLSDDTVENTPLETLQKKLNSAFNTKDHVKVSSTYIKHVLAFAQILELNIIMYRKIIIFSPFKGGSLPGTTSGSTRITFREKSAIGRHGITSRIVQNQSAIFAYLFDHFNEICQGRLR